MEDMIKRILIASATMTGVALGALGTQLQTENQPTDAASLDQKVDVKAVDAAAESLADVKMISLPKAQVPKPSEKVDDKTKDQPVATSETATAQSDANQAPTVTEVSTNANTNNTDNVSSVANSQATVTAVSQPATPAVSADIQWLIQRESGGNPNAQNGPYYGIGQLTEAYYAQYVPGQDYRGNYAVQLEAMQKYIAARYGSVANAIAHWQANNWY
ncbi:MULTISPECIES: aggregation-promoting factor C-terminal-like domain-containing protein [Leuconostoc]|uniref:Peptidoglycan-binding protein n=2 Tax=Leuconostoc pseudomesenteroides TaxID=33968 RepID=A0A5B8T7K0_LEUPS|nr:MULTISPECIES: peptidoglycan-binding protein [Leuconostoc]MCC7668545.1 peptidoglycan-binding protein [Leuconostoc pseudomesenteroides]MCC8439928.1 peptidoglycan-binding protein [Leuconostoc pseudomesenteroides]MDG9733211.1 peptidoglycan-binding protein [Leuconostoc pseudomesenteroides]MDN2450234.1 peptidoglycan-binding protein [Leuconostoc sp. UCMA20149]NKZ36751.1 peptidoglycan-binding protein [Leuconostoc pseudomesenteroides]